jgi:hypothetical protein
MPSWPFSELPRRPRLLRWFTRNRQEDDAFIQLNNLLARSRSVGSVSRTDVERIATQCGITVKQVPRRGDLYRGYLAFCLMDRQLSQAELDDLAHLREILNIDAHTADLIQRRVARVVYTRSVDEVLADEQIDERERSFLAQLRGQLGIPEGIAENIEVMRNRQLEARKPQARRPRP